MKPLETTKPHEITTKPSEGSTKPSESPPKHEGSTKHEGSEYFVQEDALHLRIKKGFVPNMKVDGMCVANEALQKQLIEEYHESKKGRMGTFLDSLTQVANVASLPGIVGRSLAMPDMHSGYGFCIGGVAAFDASGEEGIVSPGGVGFDINCGVRVVRTNLTEKDLSPVKEKLLDLFFQHLPVGVGTSGTFRLTSEALDAILDRGLEYLVQEKICWPEDLVHCEERGRVKGADSKKVSARAKERGIRQVGTLGSGNHYAELQVVDQVFDDKAAATMGFKKDQVVVMIHSGSRGLGHQVCSDYLQLMEKVTAMQKIELNDKQLAACRINSQEGKDYLAAMAAAANYGFCNRAVMTEITRKVFSEIFGKSARELDMHVVYDVSHNTAKFEEHEVAEGKKKLLLVHRKGATRSFPPHHPDIPKDYQEIGQPVFIGGSMGTTSYVLTGTEKSMKDTFGSTCHGAGRALSRAAALRTITANEVIESLKKANVSLRIANESLVAEEAAEAYKDVTEVVQTCHDAGISKMAVKLRPIGVVKG